MKKMRERLVVKKVARWSVIINAVQILLMLGIAITVMLGDGVVISNYYVRAVLVIAAGLVSWGAFVDIREALMTQKTTVRMDMLEDALEQLEQLNIKLRGQRHDFMNHLQVVYSLMELSEYDEAVKYIERTYEDIISVSSVMKTSSPAINALLMSKVSDARANGIEMNLKISSPYSDLPMESWEMCRVLGNLLDNAIDALEGVKGGRIDVELTEDLRAYGFRVFNNGPAVSPEHRELIFQTGFTTKLKGTGMGLYIVRTIMREHGGDVTLETGDAGTAFKTHRIPHFFSQLHPAQPGHMPRQQASEIAAREAKAE